ncbi:glycosyltransferase family 2 protein [Patescibacteria group bacterium]|nr:glycosyltransferase family 2 protein [Patescibacteria group bacterium]
MKKMSVIIHTLNESKNIENCIRSVNWADEIIVVDMESKDKTVKICKKYTSKVYLIKKLDYVELARNFAISKAKYDWILVLDADETLPNHSEVIIRKLLQNKKIYGYQFPRKNYVNSKEYLLHGYFYPDYQLRLFRNNKKIKYSGKIHEQPLIESSHLKICNDVIIFHNPSHSKYNSFSSFSRFFPYIKIEGKTESNNYSLLWLLIKAKIDFFRHFYRSFIKLSGYKDGYIGFRAAILFALYKSSIYVYGAYLKIKR